MKPRVLLIGVVVAVVLHSCHSASFTKSFGPASTANSKDQALQAPVIQLVRGGSCDAAHGLVGSTSVIDHRDLGNPGRISLLGLPFTFLDQVVFVSPPSYNDVECVVPRIYQNVSSFSTKPGFKLWLAENEKAEVYHGIESIGWVVLESAPGCNYFVGSTTITNNFIQVELPWGSDSYLGKRPWIFQMIQSTNNGADFDMHYDTRPTNIRGFVKTRMSLRDNSARLFQLKLETDRAATSQPVSELVAFLAIDSGCTQTQDKGDSTDFAVMCEKQYGTIVIGGLTFDYALGVAKTAASNMDTQYVSFGTIFSAPPVVLANMQTTLDPTPAEIRTKSISTTQFQFIIEEDKTVDSNVRHESEWVAWLALCPHVTPTPTPTPTPTATPSATPTPTPTSTPTCDPSTAQAVGIVGSTSSVDHHDINSPGRIDLSIYAFSFVDPVVIVGPPTKHDADAVVPRIQHNSVLSGFKLWLAETQTSNVTHGTEEIGYLVLENSVQACTYYVGKTAVTRDFTAVNLPSSSRDVLGARPWIFQMIQSVNNGADANMDASNPPTKDNLRGFVKTRMTLSDNSASRFQLKLETDQDSDTKPSWENVGFLAVNSGCTATQDMGDATDFSQLCTDQFGQITLAGVTYDYLLGVAKGAGSSQTVYFKKTFAANPVVLANLQTSLHTSSAELRVVSRSVSQLEFQIEQGQTRPDQNSVQPHGPEWVAWIAIGKFSS
eukprot:c8063_g2_i1.p1 GENE.c8063_g2_i1~~c8063_g2_i1.p1  ORF type:complete len:730 (-),score=201.50 c8063_g2_i1:73-2229(-)